MRRNRSESNTKIHTRSVRSFPLPSFALHTIVNKESVTISSKLCNMKCSCKNSIIVNSGPRRKWMEHGMRATVNRCVSLLLEQRSAYPKELCKNKRGDDTMCRAGIGCKMFTNESKKKDRTSKRFALPNIGPESFKFQKLYFNKDSSAAQRTQRRSWQMVVDRAPPSFVQIAFTIMTS